MHVHVMQLARADGSLVTRRVTGLDPTVARRTQVPLGWTLLELRTVEYTLAGPVTDLGQMAAPPQRSTKTHGKAGHWKPNAKHHYFRRISA